MGLPDSAEPPPDATIDGAVIPRKRAAALAGHRGDVDAARAALRDLDAGVRATALGALARAGAVTADDFARARDDPSAAVRRRCAEVMVTVPMAARVDLLPLTRDDDVTVVEVAAWALGELDSAEPRVVTRLAELAMTADDALVREAAVGALGALGDAAGLPAVLAAASDKATVRRRAVLALAAFDGPDVEAALEQARTDRDPQVRQAAEDLLSD
ncbi:MAG: HEAT repeat domain-containing protein [Acidimicrobiales bacterium]